MTANYQKFSSIEFNTLDLSALSADTPVSCLVLGVSYDNQFNSAFNEIDQQLSGLITHVLRTQDLPEGRGSTLLLHTAKAHLPRVLLVRLGKIADLTIKQYREICSSAAKAILSSKIRDCAWYLGVSADASSTSTHDSLQNPRLRARLAVMAFAEAAYRYDETKSQKEASPSCTHVRLLTTTHHNDKTQQGMSEGKAIAQGMQRTRGLGNLPANICTPTYLAANAQALGAQYGFAVDVLAREQAEELGMGCFLSVARGSDEPPQFIVAQYQGSMPVTAPYVLVGKGVTFDSGGISLKPGSGMDEMKFDMCGAATVLGVLDAIASLRLPINVVGIIPATENMPSGHATKPGDVITSMSGQTVEVLNTDAEGRLILCDALTYAERFKPKAVIDIATLTGACVVALGDIHAGLFSNNDDLANLLLQSGQLMGDTCWRMPLDEEYQDHIKSNFADMANIGTPGKAGSVTAACFLARYTKNYAWAHLDIAGVAWKSGSAKGAAGRPVPLLVEYFIREAEQC